MELTIVSPPPAPSPEENRTEAVEFTLVSELLGTIFAANDENLLVEAKSQDFLYDQNTGLETGKSLTTRIESGTVTGTDEEIEIRLSGTMENAYGQIETCTLYFFMWWDKTAISLAKTTCRDSRTLRPQTLHIASSGMLIRLSDSVFELDLYRKTATQQRQFLGQGRGYLVFGREF